MSDDDRRLEFIPEITTKEERRILDRSTTVLREMLDEMEKTGGDHGKEWAYIVVNNDQARHIQEKLRHMSPMCQHVFVVPWGMWTRWYRGRRFRAWTDPDVVNEQAEARKRGLELT